MSADTLIALSGNFSVDIINICSKIGDYKRGNVLASQLLRCGTSIGANIYEGNYAQSRADFISKFHIALKECYETEYWICVFYRTNIISREDYEKLYFQCSKIRKKLTASINTAKANSK